MALWEILLQHRVLTEVSAHSILTSLESDEEHGERIRPLAISFPLYTRKDVCCAKYDLYLQDSGGCLIFLFKDSTVTLATRHCGTDGKSNIQRLFEGDTY